MATVPGPAAKRESGPPVGGGSVPARLRGAAEGAGTQDFRKLVVSGCLRLELRLEGAWMEPAPRPAPPLSRAGPGPLPAPSAPRRSNRGTGPSLSAVRSRGYVAERPEPPGWRGRRGLGRLRTPGGPVRDSQAARVPDSPRRRPDAGGGRNRRAGGGDSPLPGYQRAPVLPGGRLGEGSERQPGGRGWSSGAPGFG